MRVLSAALWGVLFGAGLAVSGMTNPAKIQGFLDLFGRWDPTLALVMAGALAVSAAAFARVREGAQAWLGAGFVVPARRDLDRDLLAGAALFGVGWGLVGLCPGPALANLWRGSSEVQLFVAAMLAGVLLHRFAWQRARERPQEGGAPRAEGGPGPVGAGGPRGESA